MILYSYHCTNCGHDFDELNSIEDRQSFTCPVCGRFAEKVMSGGHFSLPGWDSSYPTAGDEWERRHESANMPELKRLGLR